MITRSGRTLTFAMYANDVPAGTSAIEAMDKAVLTVAAEN
jgi:D-alanyl-D-alanine carboxypeptidase/D-alanyl-D-alanine-endopeptidase (penicillin-binding protein 4)